MTFAEFLDYAAIAAPLSAIVAFALVWFFRTWISTQIRASIRHEYDQKLVAYKAEIEKTKEVMLLKLQHEIDSKISIYEAAQSSLSDSYKASMERKLDSIGLLWDDVLKLRKTMPPAMDLLDAFGPGEIQEYLGARQQPNMDRLFPYWNSDEFRRKMTEMDPSIEKIRPYVSHYLWAVFFSYKVIHIRLLTLVQSPFSDEEKFRWYEDEGTYGVIKNILNSRDIKEFDDLRKGRYSWLRRKLETLMLLEMGRIISGEKASLESLENASSLLQQAEQLVSSSQDQRGR